MSSSASIQTRILLEAHREMALAAERRGVTLAQWMRHAVQRQLICLGCECTRTRCAEFRVEEKRPCCAECSHDDIALDIAALESKSIWCPKRPPKRLRLIGVKPHAYCGCEYCTENYYPDGSPRHDRCGNLIPQDKP